MTHQASHPLERRPDGRTTEPPTSARIELAAQTFALLADETRVRIVWHLSGGEMSVNELAAAVGKTAATVSQHLAKLRLAGVVHNRRDGNFVHYRLADNHVGEVVEDALQHSEHVLPR